MESIKLVDVTSSQIFAIGHNGDKTLAIQFRNKDGSRGSVYHYANFPSSEFVKFATAASIGSFFYANIKNHPELYPYTKVSAGES